MLKVEYKIKATTEKDIYWHLINCNKSFIPKLSDHVEIECYSKKIFEKAITFEAWAENTLAGMVAAYFNDTETSTGYITSVSVARNYMGCGIASELLKKCIEYAVQNQFGEVKLEVNKNNEPALLLYRKHGFLIYGNSGNSILMLRTCFNGVRR